MRQIIGRRGEPHTTRRPVPEVPTRALTDPAVGPGP
jgi:hypothetical protein